MTSLELYHFWDSPCCFKVRLVLAEKGLAWDERYIMTVRFDHFQPDYRALHPHSQVPTLVHDGRPIIQSSNIAEYLDEGWPDPPLSPKDPDLRAVMREWMIEEQTFLFPLIVTMSFNLMMGLRAKAFGLDQLREWSKRHPDQKRAEDYLQRVTSPIDHQAVDAAAQKIGWHLGRLEQRLIDGGGPWICGEIYSLADISVAPILDRLDALDRADLWADLPNVGAWFARMRAREAFELAAPPWEYRMWGPTKPIPATLVDPVAAGNTFPSR